MSWIEDAERRGKEIIAKEEADAIRLQLEQENLRAERTRSEERMKIFLFQAGGPVEEIIDELRRSGREVNGGSFSYVKEDLCLGKLDKGERFGLEKQEYRTETLDGSRRDYIVSLCFSLSWHLGELGEIHLYPVVSKDGQLKVVGRYNMSGIVSTDGNDPVPPVKRTFATRQIFMGQQLREMLGETISKRAAWEQKLRKKK